MNYRILENFISSDEDGTIYLKMEYRGNQFTDLNKAYREAAKLEQDQPSYFTVEEYACNSDILRNEPHVKGCNKYYLVDTKLPRKPNSRCTCEEILRPLDAPDLTKMV